MKLKALKRMKRKMKEGIKDFGYGVVGAGGVRVYELLLKKFLKHSENTFYEKFLKMLDKEVCGVYYIIY